MKCYTHSEKNAIGGCVNCGKFICEECRVSISSKNYCKNCLSEVIGEKNKKLETLESTRHTPTVFMNSSSSASSSTSSSISNTSGGAWCCCIIIILAAIGSVFGNH